MNKRQAAFDRITKSFQGIEQRAAAKGGENDAACLEAAVMCRATCYAAIVYGYQMYDVVTDVIYAALVDCYDCCELLVNLLYRDSPLDEVAAELCAAACDGATAAVAGTKDAILMAVGTACTATAAVCKAMSDAGETEEGRGALAGTFETRTFKPELRAASDGAPTAITGYPIVFNVLSDVLVQRDGTKYREMVLPDAVQFAEEVRADFNHDSNCILGRTSNSTLSLGVDDAGVKMSVTPPDTQWARDLMVQVDRGDINQGSFAFRVLPGGESWSADRSVRTLSKILVSRVSVVADPAYASTSVQVRDAANSQQEQTSTAGQLAPPVESGGGVGIDLLRRSLSLRIAVI